MKTEGYPFNLDSQGLNIAVKTEYRAPISRKEGYNASKMYHHLRRIQRPIKYSKGALIRQYNFIHCFNHRMFIRLDTDRMIFDLCFCISSWYNNGWYTVSCYYNRDVSNWPTIMSHVDFLSYIPRHVRFNNFRSG
jgi:hypothetical protein